MLRRANIHHVCLSNAVTFYFQGFGCMSRVSVKCFEGLVYVTGVPEGNYGKDFGVCLWINQWELKHVGKKEKIECFIIVFIKTLGFFLT